MFISLHGVSLLNSSLLSGASCHCSTRWASRTRKVLRELDAQLSNWKQYSRAIETQMHPELGVSIISIKQRIGKFLQSLERSLRLMVWFLGAFLSLENTVILGLINQILTIPQGDIPEISY